MMMRKALSHLIMAQPFFGNLALKLRTEQTLLIPTAGTDGVHLIYNPVFWKDMTNDHRLAVVAHEVMHCVFHHMTRRGNRDKEKWNIAGDFVINLLLKDSGFVLPPTITLKELLEGTKQGVLLDEQFRNMSVDHVYALIPDPPEGQGGQGAGSCWAGIADPGGMGGVTDAPTDGNGGGTDAGESGKEQGPSGGSGKTTSELETDWALSTAAAAMGAKMAGNLPGSLEQFVKDLLKPQIDWRGVLRRFVMATAKADYNWMRPARKYIQAGFFLPSLHSERIGTIVVAIDTSGSVSDYELKVFCSELQAIVEETDPEEVHVLWVDTRVAKADRYTKEDLPLRLQPMGRGGTMFSPAFEWVKKNDLRPVAFVYLTDMECSDFGDEPDYPVLWISTMKNAKAPFGDIVEINAGAPQ